ncbi:MAG: 50S ribosomal protein L13 [Solitalea-like symbiont of Acarus siro]
MEYNISNSTRPVSIETIRNKSYYVVDATDKPLGRLCSVVANVLRGKHKATFTPFLACGDKVIVINSSKVKLTGNKVDQKEYIRYTNYPGGQRKTLAKDLLNRFPNRLIEKAVKGMLPKNRLSRHIIANDLKVFSDDKHPYLDKSLKTIKTKF